MEIRKSLQRSYEVAKDKSTETVDKLRQKGGRTAQVVDTSLKVSKGAASAASRASAKVMDRTSRFIGLDRYRTELESALDEAMRVIATQEARLARLEEELRKHSI